MRPRYRILIAFLLTLGWAKTLLSQPASGPAVVFSLKEWAHWAPVVGAGDPAFTLYDNRDLIYFNMDEWRREYVRLTEDEYARLLEEVIPKDLPMLDYWYMRIYATCQNYYHFYFGGEPQRLVEVYGHPTHDYGALSFEIPQSLRRCFNVVLGYWNHRAVCWLPEKIEVLVWDQFPSDYQYLQWPSDWPDLNSPDTIIRTQVDSVFLPRDLYDELMALMAAAKGIVMMNGKAMCIWYRMPIPGEEVFDQEFEEPDYEITPLHVAAARGDTAEVESLLAAGADIDARTTDGPTALYLAVQMGYSEAAELLIANGADIEAETLYGNTPLLGALDFLQADMATLLLAQGADPNAVNSMGDTGLHYTTDDRLRDVSEQLIAGGLDVNARNDANETPLYCAARDGATGVVELLLAADADVNAVKPDGRTALHAAAFHNHIEIVELLIACSADINARTKEGHTPLDYALMAGREDVAAVLRAAGGEGGVVNFSDFAKLASHWLETGCGQPNWCEGADRDYSGSVDFIDFAALAQRWLREF